MSSHSILSPSAASRWMKCPGSAWANAKADEGTISQASIDGTNAHEAAAEILEGNLLEHEALEDIPSDQHEAIMLYVNYVRMLESAYGTKAFIEQLVSAPNTHKELRGTADCVVKASNHLAYIVDYKHGQGIPVYPENNPQLMIYALGVIGAGITAQNYQLTIVQPRCMGPAIKEWVISHDDLMQFSESLKPLAIEAMKPNSGRKAGEHCRFCRVLASCKQYRENLYEVAKVKFDPIAPPEMVEPGEMSDDSLAQALELSGPLSGWVSGVKEEGLRRALLGSKIRGRKVVTRRTQRKWNNVSDAESAAVEVFGEDALTEPKLKSPAQIDKLEGGRNFSKVYSTSAGGYELAAENDPRKEVDNPKFEIIG